MTKTIRVPKKFPRLVLITSIAILFLTCSKETGTGTGTGNGNPPLKSSEAKLVTFNFTAANNTTLSSTVTGNIDEPNKNITLVLPPSTAVTNLVASFTISNKATIRVGSVNQQSNVTANNFTSPLTYTVVAEDGTTATYTVSVSVPLNAGNFITSFKFASTNNSGISRDIPGYITRNDAQIMLQNRYLTKNDFVSSFTISAGATLRINNVVQTSASSSINYSADVIADVIAANGNTRTYTIKTTSHIVSIEDFIKECPINDPNINQILADFEIRQDGVLLTSFPCTDPYYPMSAAQFNDQVKWLQTLRVLFYLDRGQSNHLPWTNLRIYDWLKSKIGGINIQTNLNGGFCCTSFNGKPFINVGKLKDNTFGNLAEIPNSYFAWSMNNFILLLHEARHLDGFPHSNCCAAGAGRCDTQYDPANLSCYGMHIWWYNAVLNRTFDFGFNCATSSFIKSLIDGSWQAMDNQRTNFCIQPTTPAKPAYWNDCQFK